LRALQKRQAGGNPTRQELAALRHVEKERDHELRWFHYGSIPKGHWEKMSGRQSKVINEQAARYKFPFGAGHPKIDLSAVVRRLHDFLAENKDKLGADSTGDPLLVGTDSPALERYRLARAKIAEHELEEKIEQLIPREQIHDGMTQLAGLLRSCGEQLQRAYGDDALDILNEALTGCQRVISSMFKDADHGKEAPTETRR